MIKEELIKNQFPNDEFLQSAVSQIVDKCTADLQSECRTCVYTDSPCVRSDYPSKEGVCSHYKNVFDENAELTEQNKHLYNDLTMTEAENTELKKENKVLTQNLEDTEILNKTLNNRDKKFKAQIEKMKSDVISERDEAKRLEDTITYVVLNNILAKWGIKEK